MKTREEKLAWLREHNRRVYRLAKGIPLDAPLSPRGRPRTDKIATKPLKYYWQ